MRKFVNFMDALTQYSNEKKKNKHTSQLKGRLAEKRKKERSGQHQKHPQSQLKAESKPS